MSCPHSLLQGFDFASLQLRTIRGQLRPNSGSGMRGMLSTRPRKCCRCADSLSNGGRRGLERKIDSGHTGRRDGDDDIIRPIYDGGQALRVDHRLPRHNELSLEL
jgi:hypothetical protein